MLKRIGLVLTLCLCLMIAPLTVARAGGFTAKFGDITWSPDGIYLTYIEDGMLNLISKAALPHVTYTYKPMSGNVTSMAWSPDGKQMVFGVEYGNKGQLFVMPSAQMMDGIPQHPTILTTFDADVPIFSPDGRMIAYTSEIGSTIQIMGLDGGQTRQPITRKGYSTPAAWSPDSSQIAYTEKQSEGDGYLLYIADATPDVAKPNWPKLVKTPTLKEDSPTWSPDGKRIAVTLPKGIALVTLADGSITTIVEGQYANDPTWSPDGKSLLYSITADRFLLYRADTNGNNSQLLVNAADHYAEYGAVWSPDGKRIAFGAVVKREGSDSYQSIFTINADGSDLKLLTSGY